jgi:hypothetical protein
MKDPKVAKGNLQFVADPTIRCDQNGEAQASRPFLASR